MTRFIGDFLAKGRRVLNRTFGCLKPSTHESSELGRGTYTLALAGNPNTGKSTVFNALTGAHQHTGNWPGKTVTRAEGTFTHDGRDYRIVDLPGTYSLLATTVDEEVARDYLLFARPSVTLIVVDAGRLERNLNLVLQVLEITERAVLCLNLVDEARRHAIRVDCDRLSELLGIPVVPTSARSGQGLDELVAAIDGVATGETPCRPRRVERFTNSLQTAIERLTEAIEAAFPGMANARWVALRLLDGDARIGQAVRAAELGRLSQGQSTRAQTDDDETAMSATAEQILSLASSLRWEVGPRFHERLTETIYTEAARIADACTTRGELPLADALDRKLDRLFTGKWTGIAVMLAMLAGVLWLTIVGANYPSGALAWLLVDQIRPMLQSGAAAIGMPWWLDGILIDGAYLATAWVVSVMLPPMAIFFPLFTLLEDFGYLPRVAFNLDGMFRRCGAHGKQSLTVCMGLGCNAAGVVATRIIDSPRERLIAIITNNFALCNGRWPTQILIAAIFVGALVPAYLAGIVSALAVLAVALLGVGLTFLVSWGLSRTVLRGEPSLFSLEMPPFRRPRILRTLYTSLVDRTLFVLWRAVVFAVPAGAVIWLVANVTFGGESVAEHLVRWLDPVAFYLGLNGIILLAYVVAIPANEIVIPTILMLTVLTTGVTGVGEQGAGVMFETSDASVTRSILSAGGWTLLTAVNLMLFSLVHNPCSTTIYTIWKETNSKRWTLVATLLPLVMGLVLCFVVAQVWRAVGS